MIFFRIGSRSKNAITGSDKWRSVLRSKGNFGAPNSNSSSLNQLDSKLGFVRSYIAGIGARKGSVSKAYLSDFCYFLANPKARRFFSTETPKKKNYQNFYPKDKKGIPKNEQKSESKEEAAGERGDSMKNVQNLIVPFLGIGLFLSLFPSVSKEEKQISLLEKKEIPHMLDLVSKLKESFGPEHREVGYAYGQLGVAYWNEGQRELGVKFLANAKDIMDATIGPNNLNALKTSQILSISYAKMGRYDLAIEIQNKVVEGFKALEPSEQGYLEQAVVTLEQMKKVADCPTSTSSSPQFEDDGEDLSHMMSNCGIPDDEKD